MDLTARALSLVPPWMRVYRIQVCAMTMIQIRGISQCRWLRRVWRRARCVSWRYNDWLIWWEMAGSVDAKGLSCHDIRMREVGIQEIHKKIQPTKVCVLKLG